MCMNVKLLFFPALFTLTAMCCQQQNTLPLSYPSAPVSAQTDHYFTTPVADPYRCLENPDSDSTRDWISGQRQLCQNYLNHIPFRKQIRRELTELSQYEKISAPFTYGAYTYYYKNDGRQAQSVLYRKDSTGKEELFIDPNTFSKDGTTSLHEVSFNKKGTLCAYSISEGGTDWLKIITINARTRQIIDSPLNNIKFSAIAWQGDKGFYYSTYPSPVSGHRLAAKTESHQIYFHRLGTPQSGDTLILGGSRLQRRYLSAGVSEDERYLIISAANATNGNELYIKDLNNNTDFIPVIQGFSHNSAVVTTSGDTIYIITDKDAPNKRLVQTTIRQPARWKTLIPEKKEVLQISSGGGCFFALYLKDVHTQVQQFNTRGQLLRTIALPAEGTASGFSGKSDEQRLYYSFSNYITPKRIYAFNVADGRSQLYHTPAIAFNSDTFVSEQIFYSSTDGTKIPMTISYKKGLALNGKNPTILYGYGGFNISIQPRFSEAMALWMQHGGIYAVANIRGGGEYGKKWHDAGTKMNKKNVFQDFIAAALYLQEKGYTSAPYLAISGRSNGGLLIGATMTMRPDLCKVALPGVGVLDMLRYHQFTAGAGWAYDYGTADDSPEMFAYLKSYSPLHNIKDSVCYPATLIITGDHDDRVVPAHSFKFAAALQARQSCTNPILIRIAANAGHGAGRATRQIIEENTDLISFTLYEMGRGVN